MSIYFINDNVKKYIKKIIERKINMKCINNETHVLLVGKLPIVIKKIKCRSALADGTSDKATLKFHGFAVAKNANSISHNSNLFPVFSAYRKIALISRKC